MTSTNVNEMLIWIFGLNIFFILGLIGLCVLMFLKGSDYYLNYKTNKLLATQKVDYYLSVLDNIIDIIFNNIVLKAIETSAIKTNSKPYVNHDAAEELILEVYEEVLTALSSYCRLGIEMAYDASYVDTYIYKEIEKRVMEYAIATNTR